MEKEKNNLNDIIKKSIKKGKKVLHNILKKKARFHFKAVIEELDKEIEERMNLYLFSMLPKLKNIQFEDKEQSLKIIILKALINILKKMVDEHSIKLSEEDNKLLDNILEDDN